MFSVDSRVSSYHSQYEQDRLLDRHLFRGMTGGVFVDIGAHDGAWFNNTLTFEEDYGWTGLCIEANPSVFPKLRAGRSVPCLNIAIADYDGEMPFYQISGAPEMLSGLVAASEDWHLQRVHREIDRDGGSLQIINVPTKRLDVVLAENDLTEVHYLSIDTEGNEAAIVSTIDHDRALIHVIDAECNKKEELPALLAAAGPRFHYLGRDESDAFFINRQSPLAARRRALQGVLAARRARRRVRKLLPRKWRGWI